jgi:hypothetical protein
MGCDGIARRGRIPAEAMQELSELYLDRGCLSQETLVAGLIGR